jgi:4-diphosphocytidyl-2C-methyl-D-erythritol kinase
MSRTIDLNIRRYSNGLEKLHLCNANVEIMKEELNDLQPMLKQKTREVQGLLVTLEKDQKGSAISSCCSSVIFLYSTIQMQMRCAWFAREILMQRLSNSGCVRN